MHNVDRSRAMKQKAYCDNTRESPSVSQINSTTKRPQPRNVVTVISTTTITTLETQAAKTSHEERYSTS